MVKLPRRYTPIACPTTGGFSEVICCKDNHLDRKVAIKYLKDEREKRRLKDELLALLQMRSKHVVQVYDIIPDDSGAIGIVEEFVEGEDLWVSDFPQKSTENYLKTLWQVASGIADIHNAGVIHRDIKPNNIKLDDEGIVKIFDFGLAREEGVCATTKGFKGTPGFAAPELFNSETIAFTNGIDIYAFGATAIFLACQNLPPELCVAPPQPVISGTFSRLPISVPSPLAELLEKCLAHNPLNRPPMSVVRDEIARYLLQGKHQALAVYEGRPYFINANDRSAGLDLLAVGKIEIMYDGLKFLVYVATGEVYINNEPATSGMQISGSCVVALGGSHRKNTERAFIAIDISNPEVVL